MLCINNTYNDTYFNLAAEEYLLKNSEDAIFMLWQNQPSVVIGKYQDIRSEVNLEFTDERYIRVARRFTGGGAVFQDDGNLNLSFFETNTHINFDKFSSLIISLLAETGIHAQQDERRSILINQLKISGSAQCVRKNRVLYHATLLYSSNLNDLEASLDVSSKQRKENSSQKKSVQSVKSPVTNVSDHLGKPVDIERYRQMIFDYFLKKDAENWVYRFNENDMYSILELKDRKYATYEWNFNGRSTI